MFVPDKLKKIRKERKLTQAELAKKANMGVNSITRYEKGQRTPPIEETLKIAKALDIKPSDLFTGEQRAFYERFDNEVKHGKWEYSYDDLDINRCSCCGFYVQDKISNVQEMFSYCPNCGAKMDNEEKCIDKVFINVDENLSTLINDFMDSEE